MGAKGLLGQALADVFKAEDLVAVDRDTVDITDKVNVIGGIITTAKDFVDVTGISVMDLLQNQENKLSPTKHSLHRVLFCSICSG